MELRIINSIIIYCIIINRVHKTRRWTVTKIKNTSPSTWFLVKKHDLGRKVSVEQKLDGITKAGVAQ